MAWMIVMVRNRRLSGVVATMFWALSRCRACSA
jgi:hypothetical protein